MCTCSQSANDLFHPIAQVYTLTLSLTYFCGFHATRITLPVHPHQVQQLPLNLFEATNSPKLKICVRVRSGRSTASKQLARNNVQTAAPLTNIYPARGLVNMMCHRVPEVSQSSASKRLLLQYVDNIMAVEATGHQSHKADLSEASLNMCSANTVPAALL